MATVKDIIRNELMKEIAAIRLDTAWKMLALKKEGRFPKIDDEGSTGEFDNKGAMFVPGHFIFEDSDKKPVEKQKFREPGPDQFRKMIREAMRYDNATLLYPDGMAVGININNGFFAEMSGNILAIKQAAMKRKTMAASSPPEKINSFHITRSLCPGYVNAPYGARTKLSSCIAVCITEPMLYYVQCRNVFGLRGQEEDTFWTGVGASRKPIMGENGIPLAPPYVVVCHTTMYKERVYTGLTRILGLGKFGEFATFTLEEPTSDLLNELDIKDDCQPGDIFAEYEGTQVIGVLRFYPKTTPGKRLLRTTAKLISPVKDLELDVEKIGREARQRYGME